MSVLYLYALAARDPGLPGSGLAGEPVRVISCGPGLVALAGELPGRPPVSRQALTAHDETVRRLAGLVPALLPARFGETAPSELDLCARLAPRTAELAAAVALVEGAVQMTLRIFLQAPPEEATNLEAAPAPSSVTGEAISRGRQPSSDSLAGRGPGARYLAERRRAHAQRHSLPEVASLRGALQPLLKAERIERHEAGRLLATAHDLVGRDSVAAYRSIVERESAHLAGYRVAASGPWPPYAFAPAVVP